MNRSVVQNHFRTKLGEKTTKTLALGAMVSGLAISLGIDLSKFQGIEYAWGENNTQRSDGDEAGTLKGVLSNVPPVAEQEQVCSQLTSKIERASCEQRERIRTRHQKRLEEKELPSDSDRENSTEGE